MKFPTRPAIKIIDPTEWHRVFAFWPRKIELAASMTPDGYVPAHRWVACQFIERRACSHEHHIWCYRLPQREENG